MLKQSISEEVAHWIDLQLKTLTYKSLGGIERVRASLIERDGPWIGNAKQEAKESNVEAQNDPTDVNGVPPRQALLEINGGTEGKAKPRPADEATKPMPAQPVLHAAPVPPVIIKPGGVIVNFFDRLNGVVAKEDIVANDPTGFLRYGNQILDNQYSEHVGKFEGGTPIEEVSHTTAYTLATGLTTLDPEELKYFGGFRQEWLKMSPKNRMCYIYEYARQRLSRPSLTSSLYCRYKNDPQWWAVEEDRREQAYGRSDNRLSDEQDNEPIFF